jgi:MFS family permease
MHKLFSEEHVDYRIN